MDKTSDTECVFTDRECVFRGTPAVRQKPDAASFCCEFKQVFVPVCLSLCLEFQNLTWKFCIYSLQMSGSLCLFILLVSIFPQTSSLSHTDLCFFFVFRTFDRSIDYRLCDCKCDKLQMNCSLEIDHGVWGDIILTGQPVSHTRKHPHHKVITT